LLCPFDCDDEAGAPVEELEAIDGIVVVASIDEVDWKMGSGCCHALGVRSKKSWGGKLRLLGCAIDKSGISLTNGRAGL
jgi:hypothetical protein